MTVQTSVIWGMTGRQREMEQRWQKREECSRSGCRSLGRHGKARHGQYRGIPSLGGGYWSRGPRLQGGEGLVTSECDSSAPMAACRCWRCGISQRGWHPSVRTMTHVRRLRYCCGHMSLDDVWCGASNWWCRSRRCGNGRLSVMQLYSFFLIYVLLLVHFMLYFCFYNLYVLRSIHHARIRLACQLRRDCKTIR